jgi:hypothetical protein
VGLNQLNYNPLKYMLKYFEEIDTNNDSFGVKEQDLIELPAK